MPKPSHHADDAKISAAALRIAAAKGWNRVTIDAVAKAAQTPAARLKARFAAAPDLVPLIAAEIDREAFASGKFAGAPHDILFDLLMARFDILQKHRKAILNMSAAAKTDRALACALARATMQGACRVIDAAKLDAAARPIFALGLTAIYGWAFRAWRDDESRDMAKTMAALDRALRVADKAAGIFIPRS